jgi:hypothetical protein
VLSAGDGGVPAFEVAEEDETCVSMRREAMLREAHSHASVEQKLAAMA